MDEEVVPVVEGLRRRLPVKVNVTGQGQGEEESCAQDGGEENEFPFEFRALEVVLEATCSFLDARTRELETNVYPALDELTSKISSRNLDKVRKLKSAMTRLTNRVHKIREELENLLDDDDDMAELYLSRKLSVSSSPSSSSEGPNWHHSPNQGSKIKRSSKGSATTLHGENDVEELEMLLEVGHLGEAYEEWVHQPIVSKEGPRFFQNEVLEFLTLTVWWAISVIWLPVVCWFVYNSVQMGLSCPHIALMVVLGILVWTLLEYTLHRFLFHIKTNTYWGNTMHYLLHGCHHKHPMDGLRLVFPPAATAILLFPGILTWSWLLPVTKLTWKIRGK